jgi:hypothetical protein
MAAALTVPELSSGTPRVNLIRGFYSHARVCHLSIASDVSVTITPSRSAIFRAHQCLIHQQVRKFAGSTFRVTVKDSTHQRSGLIDHAPSHRPVKEPARELILAVIQRIADDLVVQVTNHFTLRHYSWFSFGITRTGFQKQPLAAVATSTIAGYRTGRLQAEFAFMRIVSAIVVKVVLIKSHRRQNDTGRKNAQPIMFFTEFRLQLQVTVERGSRNLE